MKESRTIHGQTIHLMQEWIWPLLALQGLFAIFFVSGPMLTMSHPTNFSLMKIDLLIVFGVLSMTGILAYDVRCRTPLARRWFIFASFSALSLAAFSAGFSVQACFQLQWYDDGLSVLLVFFGLVGIAVLTWRHYTPILEKLHRDDCQTGRFNLEQGTYSFRIPPSFHEFKTSFLRKAVNTLLPYSGVFIAISAASGAVSRRRPLYEGKDVFMGWLGLFIAMGLVATATAAFYTYRFIRRWEKQTGRTMWIEGFEPGAPTE